MNENIIGELNQKIMALDQTINELRNQLGKESLELNAINNEYLSSYIAPEILYNFPYSKEKCNSWSLGCVLYELIFKKRAFDYEERQKYILKNRFEIPDDCERDFKTVIQKLLCKDFNRLTISDLVFEVTFKRKVIELNLFDEIIKGSIQCKYIFIFIIIKYIL